MRITFGPGDLPLEEYDHLFWEIGEVRNVEFFPDYLVPVTLIVVTQPDLDTFLHNIDDGSSIAIDLEWDDELCLFQFCTSKGVLVIRHPKGPGNETLREFLKSHKFYGKGIENDKKMLQRKFGETFEENIEDIAKTRLRPYGHSENFNTMTLQFAGAPVASFKDIRITTSNWGQEVLTMRQVMYAAFDVVALFVAYPRFPPAKEMEKKCKKQKNPKQKSKYHKEMKFTPLALMPTFSYILKNYTGSLLPPDLRNLFHPEDLDYVYAWRNLVFVSLYKPMDTSRFSCEVQELPPVDISLSSDSDDFYVTRIPECLRTKVQFHNFLYCFGVDHSVRMFKTYVRVCTYTALESHRLRTFLPHLEIDGFKMELSNFPYFNRQVAFLHVPDKLKHGDAHKLFSTCGPIKSLSLYRRESVTVKVTYVAQEAVDRALEMFDNKIIDGNEIHAVRGCDLKQLRHMREYELFVTDCKSRQELMKRFSVYGKIYDAHYDPKLDISHVLFISKADALRAQSETARFAENGSCVSIKGIAASTPYDEIVELGLRYGKVITVRSLHPSRTTLKTEVTFVDAESAARAQAHLNGIVVNGHSWTASIEESNTLFPQWKKKWKNQWLCMRHNGKTLAEMIEMCSSYGYVVDATMNDRIVYIFFAASVSATAAFKALKDSHKASYLSMLQFIQNTNSKDLSLELVPTLMPARSDDNLAVVIDPLPTTITEDILLSACQDLGAPTITASRVDETMFRAVIFCTNKQKDIQPLCAALSRLSTDGKELPMRVEHVADLAIPKSESRRSRILILVNPIPPDFDEASFRSLIDEVGTFNLRRTPSATVPNAEMIRITSKKTKPLKQLVKFIRKNAPELPISVKLTDNGLPQ